MTAATIPDGSLRQRIAIVGSGVSGLVAAHVLDRRHDVTLYEASARPGGHVNTVHVDSSTGPQAIDTGFIVFNEENYPGFVRLLSGLGVASQKSDMSFSVSCPTSGLEYRTSNLNTLFAQRSNMARPSFLRILADIPRHNRAALRLIATNDQRTSLREFLAAQRFSRQFVNHYLVPLGASIWSTDPRTFLDFPAAALARFLDRHGLLKIGKRPSWRVVRGGSDAYVNELTRRLTRPVRTNAAVRRIERTTDGVRIFGEGIRGEDYDAVVIATHAPDALAMLQHPTDKERELVGAFRYQTNRATLHTDASLMPTNRRAWASWNYHHHSHDERAATLTYHANRLQELATPEQYCVTLNSDDAIDPASMLASFDYDHPVFDSHAMAMQPRHGELLGANRTYFCGAYWGYGFHEDGVKSGEAVCEAFGMAL